MLDSPPASPPPEPPAAVVHFGGVDRPPRALRDLLLERVNAAPPGSEIVWATYYFRDPALAEALIAAKQRGVRVRLALEGEPRRPSVNKPTIARLKAGLGDGLRLHRSWLQGHLHAKIYAFSGPTPSAFIGSYNPSGGVTEPELIADIGDQDRGENLLVDFRDPAAVTALAAQARRIWEGRFLFRFSRRANTAERIGDDVSFYYFPRLRPDVVERRLGRLGDGDAVRAAVSHMKKGAFASKLAAAARRGAKVELVVHDTKRRVPRDVVAELRRSGVQVMRFCDPEDLPMHAKFVIIDHHGRRTAWFGSLNYNFSSRFLNQEILAGTAQPHVVEAFEGRFRRLAGEAASRTCPADAGRATPPPSDAGA